VTLAARIAVCCLVALTGHVYAAGPRAGVGSAQISGYTIDDIRYELQSDNSSQLAAVSFRIEPDDAARVTVRLGEIGSPDYRSPRPRAGSAARPPGPPSARSTS
jgi:hypothetical protein